jgi:hypothetical protein
MYKNVTWVVDTLARHGRSFDSQCREYLPMLVCSKIAICHLHILISYHQFTLLTIQCLHNDKDLRGLSLETFDPVSTTFAELVWVGKQPETLELADGQILKALPNVARASSRGSDCIFGSIHARRVRNMARQAVMETRRGQRSL